MNPYLLISMNSAAPTPTGVCLRSPALFCRISRSSPMVADSSRPIIRRNENRRPPAPRPVLEPGVHRFGFQRQHSEYCLVDPPQRLAPRAPVQRFQSEGVLPQRQ
jgi:hypothetical protein